MKKLIKKVFKSKTQTALIGVGLVAVTVVSTISINANAAIKVNSGKAEKGELSNMLEVNGKVDSEVEKVYFSKVDGVVGAIQVKEGDFIKKGDVIMIYDAEDLERQTALAEYNAQAQLGSYNNSIQTGKKTASLYGEATKNLKVLNQQITDTQAALTQKQNELAQKKASLAEEGAKLGVSLIDWSDKPDSDEYENLQKLIENNGYEQQYASEIIEMQNEINNLTIALEGFKEYKAEMTSQKASTQTGLLTDGAKEQLEAVKAANEIVSNELLDNYEEATKGIKADFDGVITKINVVPGSNIAAGEQLFTLKSTDDANVKIYVNKYDIVNIEEEQYATVTIKNKEYEGKVSRISRMADEQQSGGIGVEVKIDDPDSDVILGMETKVRIKTADLTDALSVPLAALWEDEEGTFLFIEKDGVAVKTEVETGIRNEEKVEILSGIKSGDIVVWSDTSEIKDGMSVKVD